MATTTITTQRGPIVKNDGGGYVHKTDNDHVVDVHIPKKQSRTTMLRNMMSSTVQPKQELSSLERYRKEVEAAKTKNSRPGLLLKAAGAMSSIRNLQVDDDDDDEDVLHNSFASEGKRSRNSSFSLELTEDEKQVNSEAKVTESGFGIVRSASTSSLKGSEKGKYKNMFKKAVNLVMANSGTGAGFAQKDTNLDAEILPLGGKETFQDKAESMQPFSIPKHSNRYVSTISSQESGDDDSDSESEEMTLKELKDFIFQCPNDMTLGDLKQFILKKEGKQEDKPYLGIARPSSGSLSRARSDTSTSTSGSLTRHRPRSASRARRRSGTGGEGFQRADTGLNPAERRNSAGRRRNSSSLSSNSDHVPRRRRSGSSGDLLSTSNHSVGSINAESRRRRSSRPRRSKTSSSASSSEVAKDAVRGSSSDRRRRNRLSRASSNPSLISSKKGPSPASDAQNRRSSSLRSLVNDIETTEDERVEASRMNKGWSEFEEAPLKSIPLL